MHKYQAHYKSSGRKIIGNQGHFFDRIWARIHNKNFKGNNQSSDVQNEISQIINKYHNYEIQNLSTYSGSLDNIRLPTKKELNVYPLQNESYKDTLMNKDAPSYGINGETGLNYGHFTPFEQSKRKQAITKFKVLEPIIQNIPPVLQPISGCSFESNCTTKKRISNNISRDPDPSVIKHMVERAAYAASANPTERTVHISKALNPHQAGMYTTAHLSTSHIPHKLPRPKPHTKPKSFFTSDDDTKLLNGIMKYGDKWNLIWSGCGLSHIPRSLLRDRASTQQFQELLRQSTVLSQRAKLKTPDVNIGTEYKWLSSQTHDNHINVTRPLYRDYRLSISTEPVVACTPYEDICFLSPSPFGKSDGFGDLLRMDDRDKSALQHALIDNYESDEDFEVTQRNLDSL